MDFASGVLSLLWNSTVRGLCIAALAAGATGAFRLRSAAARHAVWSLVAGGMILVAPASMLMPAIPLPVLRRVEAPARAVSPLAVVETASAPASLPPPPTADSPGVARVGWGEMAVAVYGLGVLFFLARLAFGLAFTRRLVRASRLIERPWVEEETHESAWISVPMTVGWLRPRILLPAGWQEWSREKLGAVLAHERAHVRRFDWALSLLAGVNRCVFWFHPLAWWLERRIASLAEQACDDAALREVGTDSYAEALLEMAAAVRTGQGRLVWEAMAMAKPSEVRKRIELILDETRRIPTGVTRLGWAVLLACGVPLIYIASVIQPVPAHAQVLNPAEKAQVEQRLATNPQDLGARKQLVLSDFAAGVREPRLSHIYWLIANHPESQEAGLLSLGITPRPTVMNTAADYARAAELWKQQAAVHASDARVLGNAARFFAQPGGDYETAERLFLAARKIEPLGQWSRQLGQLYASALMGATGDPNFDNSNPGFAVRVRTEIENSSDRQLVASTVNPILEATAASSLNMAEHPLLTPVREWAARLFNNGQQVAPPSASAASSAQPAYPPAPAPIKKVDPEYPPLAKQARIAGVVQLYVTIGPDGTLREMQAFRGHPLLISAAMEAVRQWTWSGSAQGTYTVEVPFTLNDTVGGTPTPAQPPSAGSIRIPQSLPPAPAAVRAPQPVYPPLALQAHISSVVQLKITIDGNGLPIDVQSIGGHPLLVPAAIEAVRKWQWDPASAGTYGLSVPFALPEAAGETPAISRGGVLGGIISSVPGAPALKIISRVQPVYPAAAREAHIEGTVRVRFRVAGDGHTENVEAIDGHPLLQAAAVEAVKQWVYEPPSVAGETLTAFIRVSPVR